MEEYISVDDIRDFNRDHVDIFQIQPEKKGFKEVKIGEMLQSGNVLIKELDYEGKKLRIVSCLYTKDEIIELKKRNMLPIVEIYIYNKDLEEYRILSYCARVLESDFVIVDTENNRSTIIDQFNESLNKDSIIEKLIFEITNLLR